MERIPVFLPYIDNDTKMHVNEALDIGWLGMGSFTKEFEEKISSYLELKNRFVVATNTGTSALHIALKVAGVGPGDEVITPSFNYVADHQAIKMAGGEVVMCDICEDNLGINPQEIEKLISSKTKAIIPLHFAGIPCNQKQVFDIAKKYGLRVIEDAMHAFGTKIDGHKIGSYGDITCFSFDPVKIITSIDGGCVIVNSKEEEEKLHRLRFLGVDKDTIERYKNKRSWEYDVVSEGFRYHLTNIMSSIGISQIKKIDEFILSRQDVCKQYNKAFQKVPEIKILDSNYNEISPFIYVIRVMNKKREKLIEHLQKIQIDVGIHFIPVHKHSNFKKCKKGDMKVTDEVSSEILTLPLHSNMKNDHMERVIKGVTEFF